jgi:hypothetical protein
LTFLATAAVVVASGSNNSTLNDIEPGALGFLVVAGIGVALIFLLKNMNKQFKKLGPPPEETDVDTVGEPAENADPEGAARTGDPEQDAAAKGASKRK